MKRFLVSAIFSLILLLLSNCQTRSKDIFPRANLTLLMQAKFEDLEFILKEKNLLSRPDNLRNIKDAARQYLTPEQKKEKQVDNYTEGAIFTLVAPKSYIPHLAAHGFATTNIEPEAKNYVVLELPKIFLKEYPYTVADRMGDYWGQLLSLSRPHRFVVFSHEDSSKIAARLEEDLKRNDSLAPEKQRYENELVFRSPSIPLKSFWVHVVNSNLVAKIKTRAREEGWKIKETRKEGTLFSFWLTR